MRMGRGFENGKQRLGKFLIMYLDTNVQITIYCFYTETKVTLNDTILSKTL